MNEKQSLLSSITRLCSWTSENDGVLLRVAKGCRLASKCTELAKAYAATGERQRCAEVLENLREIKAMLFDDFAAWEPTDEERSNPN